MLSTWYTSSFPSKVAPPGFRYKQTAVTFINDASATYDGAGYVSTLNNTANRFGDACTAKFTVDPTKGDVFAIGFTRTRNPSAGSSSTIQYQSGSAIATVAVWSNDTQILFNGTFYTLSGTINANNKLDLAIVLDFATKTVKLLYSLVVGGPKTLLAEKPFQNVAAGYAIQLYVDAGPSQASNILAYNNVEFAL